MRTGIDMLLSASSDALTASNSFRHRHGACRSFLPLSSAISRTHIRADDRAARPAPFERDVLTTRLRTLMAVHAYLMEIPLVGGSSIVVEVSPTDESDELTLASRQSDAILTKANTTLSEALEKVKPAINAMESWARSSTPDEITLEFGLKLGGHTGVIIASGSAEVNFAVKLTWTK